MLAILAPLLAVLPLPQSPGDVLSAVKLSATEGGFSGSLDTEDRFGAATAALGDIDGDGVEDVAIAAPFDDDGGFNRGAVWILFMTMDGTVKSEQMVSDTQGGFTGVLSDDDRFGRALAGLGDLDDDGVADIAVGAPLDNDGGANTGAVWILFLNSDGTVKSHQKISAAQGGFSGLIENQDYFGRSLSTLPDMDGDGNPELVSGAVFDDDGGSAFGAVWILFLADDGTVKGHQKISATQGGFAGTLNIDHRFGSASACAGDVDGDGTNDLAVGGVKASVLFPEGATTVGCIWLLLLNGDGTVKTQVKITEGSGGFVGDLDEFDYFGRYIANVEDIDGNGVDDLAVGAQGDDDGGDLKGAVWLLMMQQDGTVKDSAKITALDPILGPMLLGADELGTAVSYLGDIDGNGARELLIGAPEAYDKAGSCYVVSLAPGVLISSVDSAPASAPGILSIHGQGFDATTTVTLGGQPEPVLSFAPDTLTVQPAPQAPGTVQVEVTNSLGAATGSLSLWPTLSTQSTGVGGTLDASLDNGSEGLYVLIFGTAAFPSPITISAPPTWYGVLVDITQPWGTADIGSFPTPAPVNLTFPVPDNPAWSGLELHLQAWCQQGFFGPEVTYGFTNLASATL